MHDETRGEVSSVYRTKDQSWLLPGLALKVERRTPGLPSGGRRAGLQRDLSDAGHPVVLKAYSNEFHSFVLEEVLKILALNVGMAYVVDQANVMYANLDHGGLLPLFVL